MTATVSPGNNKPVDTNTITFRSVSRSTFYTIIPLVVRSRIPVLTSLRHTAKSIVSHSSRAQAGGYAPSVAGGMKEQGSHSVSSTTDSSGATTPITRLGTPEGNMPSPDLVLAVGPALETTSGINWDVALTGVRLWSTARTQAGQGGNPRALRSMHIDALRYMSMALPIDLTPLEIQTLRASMPRQLISQSNTSGEADVPRPPNLLRQSIAQAICWLFAGLLVILPIIMTLLNRLLQYERQHRLTERVIANGVQVTSNLGERGVEVHQALVRFRDGHVGGACVDLGSWAIEGIVGGVTDGLDAVAQGQRNLS